MNNGPIWGTLPDRYPTELAEEVFRRLIDELGDDSPARHKMGYGFTGAAFRFKAMTNYGNNLKKLIETKGLAPLIDDYYEQQRSLFSFFVNCQSSFESFFFALHAIGAHYDQEIFDLSNETLGGVYPGSVTDRYENIWLGNPLVIEMRSFIASKEYKKLKKIRNVLLHRAVPPSLIAVDVGGKTRRFWQIEKVGMDDADEEISETTIDKWTEWASQKMNSLWVALETFPLKHNHPH